jgi:hypothetical protein
MRARARHRRPFVGVLTAAAILGAIAIPPPALGEATHVLDVSDGIVARAVTEGACESTQSGGTFIVSCGPNIAVQNGPLWSLYLQTPIAGSAIEAVSWDVGRSAHPSTNLQMEVVDNLGRLVHFVGEDGIPSSPQFQTFNVPIESVQAQLRLSQINSQTVPSRSYTINNPRLIVRDLARPSSAVTGMTTEWIRAGSAGIAWQVEDNFGSDGVGLQRIEAAKRTLFSGTPGVGSHSAALDVSRIPDGSHLLLLQVIGNGTQGAPPVFRTLRIDRTPPDITLSAMASGPNRAKVTISVKDATSGGASWVIRAPTPNGRVVAEGNHGGGTIDVDLRPLVPRGSELRFFAEGLDRAGNLASATSEPVHRAGPTDGSPAYPLGPPERLLEEDAAALADFAKVTTSGLRTPQAAGYRRGRGAIRIPQVRVVHGGRIQLSASFRTGRRPLAGAAVYLVDPHGRAQGRKLTRRDGTVSFTIRAHSPGTWRAVALGRPLVSAPLRLAVTPRVSARIATRFLRPGETLTVKGQVRPADAGALKQVQLQALLRGSWRPVVQARANRRGNYTLRYRFVSAAGSYEVPMRVVVPRERGWPYAPVVARRFTVAVSG